MLRLVDGPNFSGRTTLLRKAIEEARDRQTRSVSYVGPEVFTSFSGLAATVAGELELVGVENCGSVACDLGINHLLDRELATLSGGEEVLCSIAAALVCDPAQVALDCVFEQLDPRHRQDAIAALLKSTATTVLLADNRSGEWANGVAIREPLPTSPTSNNTYGTIRGNASIVPCEPPASPIRISGLRHRYGNGRWILDGTDLTLTPGTVVHLAGENGAGKSTLAKLLVGAIVPSAGAIEHARMKDPWRTPGRIASYHFQNPDMQLFRSTVRDELRAGAAARRLRRDTCDSLVDTAVSLFGLSGVLARHPQELPFSMRKRVAMAATLACGTPWIILDEPTLGQDDAAADQLGEYLERMAAAGFGVLVISHSERFVDSLCRSRIELVNGTLTHEERSPCR